MATANENYDGLASFPDGINSGIDPTLLPKTQLGYAVNATMRGTFIGPRPEFDKRELIFPSSGVQSNFQTGLWQGACFYQPDTANAQLVASIAGRLYAIDLITLAVSDISIINDLNPSAVTQAWLWQAERWVIVNDGISLPIFYDGVSSRRSVQLTEYGIVNTGNTIPADGTPTAITVKVPGYTGPIGAAVLIGVNTGAAEIFQVASSSSPTSFLVTLTSVNDSIGTTYPTGTQFVSNPNVAGIATLIVIDGIHWNIIFSTPFPGAVGDTLQIPVGVSGTTAPVISISTDRLTVVVPNRGGTPRPGIIYFAGSTQPSSVAFTLASDFASLAAGSSQTIVLSTPYTGASGAMVIVGSKAYIATLVGSSVAPPTTINLINNNGADLAVAANAIIFSVPELPPGRMGCYGLGRNWFSLTNGVSYAASDLVGGPSGSATYGYRDSVLKMVENTFLAGGGSFSIPVSGDQITAMRFCANLDLALGQGPLQIFVQGGAFSCNAPIDRTVWEVMTNPIQTQSLIANGSMSHKATVLVNSDILFRSPDGFRSFILARRDFNTHGNVPISFEITRLIDGDASALLSFESGVNFDNRWLTTAHPTQGPNGVYHTAIAVMNNDPISTLREKLPPIWEGEWTGLNCYELVLARVLLVDRAYAFHRNSTTGATELYEILKSDTSRTGDTAWNFESPSIFQRPTDRRQFQRLLNGELWVDKVDGALLIEVSYRADDSTTWTPWRSWTEDANSGTFKPRMGIGMPSTSVCDAETGRLACDGYEFFVRVQITGKCRVKGMRFISSNQPEPKFKEPKCQ